MKLENQPTFKKVNLNLILTCNMIPCTVTYSIKYLSRSNATDSVEAKYQ